MGPDVPPGLVASQLNDGSELHPVNQVETLESHRSLLVTTYRPEVFDVDIANPVLHALFRMTTEVSSYRQSHGFLR